MVWHLIFGGYIVGIGIGLISHAPWLLGACFVLAIGILSVWFRNKRALGIVVALGSLSLGYVHAHTMIDEWDVAFDEQKVTGQALVMQEPELKDQSQAVIFRFTDCREQICPQQLVMGTFPVHEVFHYGTLLTLTCPLKVPKNTTPDFDYRMYLAMKGIGFVCYPQQWQREGNDGGNVSLRFIFHLRNSMEDSLDRFVVYPESGLGKGLLFGGNSYLTKETQTMFSRTGMSHIVAVSGANVVIIAESLFLLMIACGLWRRQALVVAGGGILFFVIMVGASASAVRAGLMGGLVLLASFSGRVSDGFRLWSLSAAVMLYFNPLLLRYDLGFQLSFMATLGILSCMPLFEVMLRTKKYAMLQEIIWMSIAAELFVLPIIFYNFHTFSTISLVANVLVLPVIPIAMLFGFLTSLFGFIFIPIASLFGLIAYLILHYMMSMIMLLGGQSFASIPVTSFGVNAVMVWYITIFTGVFFLRKKYV